MADIKYTDLSGLEHFSGTIKSILDGKVNIGSLGSYYTKAQVNDLLSGKSDIHSHNYLPLGGGTISGKLTIDSSSTGDNPLTLISNQADANGACRIQFRDSNNAFLGYVMTGWGNLALSHRSYNQLGVGDSGIWCSSDNGNTKHGLIHAGNIGSYALKTDGSNTMAVGINWDNASIGTNVDTFGEGFIVGRTTDDGTTLHSLGCKYASVLNVSNGTYRFQIASSANHTNKLLYRGYDANVKSYYDWKTIAFTDSNITGNAGSATKLQTARTIWGQSFDGTGNVNGVLYDISGIEFLNPVSYNYLIIGQGFAKIGYPTYLDGNNVYLRYGTEPTIGLTLNSSGNVTIGASDLAGTGVKLYVAGQIMSRDGNNIYQSNTSTRLTSIISDNIGRLYTYDGANYCDTYIGRNDGKSIVAKGNGNVLIGTTTDSGYKLNVNGSANATTLYENGTRVSLSGHTHTKSQITDFPTSLPANGGNSDTVDNLHASDLFRAYSTTSSGSYDNDYGQSVITFDPIVNGTYPESNPNVTILNLGDNINRRKQLSFNYNNNNIYYRRNYNGTWNSWVRLALASDIPDLSNLSTSINFKGNVGLTFDSSGVTADNVGSMISGCVDTASGTTLANAGYRYCAVLNVGGTGIDTYRMQLASYAGGGNKLLYRGYDGNNRSWCDWVILYHSGNLSKSTLGLGNVDNTADKDKSVNYATSAGSATDQTARNAAAAAQTTANGKWTYNASTIAGVKVDNASVADSLASLSTGKSGTDLPFTYPEGLSNHMVYAGTSTEWPYDYGNALTIRGTGTTQLMLTWNASQTSSNPNVAQNIYIRSQRDSAGNNWSKWTTILTDSNIGSYASPLTHTHTSFANNISVTGSVTASAGFFDTSDARLKDFYDDIDVDFDKLRAIPKKYFSWKSDENKEIHLGTSAQEIQQIYPELVKESDTGELSVDYAKLSVVSLAAVDQLYDKISKIEQALIDKGIL